MWFCSMLESHFSVFAFFQNMSHQDNFYEEQEVDFQGWRGIQGCKNCKYIAEQTQGCVLFRSKRMRVVVNIWRCLVWSMLLVMRALDLVSGLSCHWQWTGSIFFFSGDFLWGVAWWRLLSWISIADRWYHLSEMWAGNAIVRVRIESLNRSTLDFHLGTTYQRL